VIKLRELIKAKLVLILPSVYFNRAPPSAVFPFISFSISSSYMDGEVEVWGLDVDVWDKNADTTTLENIANDICGSLHRAHLIGDGISIKIYKENRLSPDDDDPAIKRRKITFQARCLDNDQIRR